MPLHLVTMLYFFTLNVDMAAAAVPDGLHSDYIVWRCDCSQCAVSVDQHVCHDMTFQTASGLSDHRQAAHAMIYAIHDHILFNEYRTPADIMVCYGLRCAFPPQNDYLVFSI